MYQSVTIFTIIDRPERKDVRDRNQIESHDTLNGDKSTLGQQRKTENDSVQQLTSDTKIFIYFI